MGHIAHLKRNYPNQKTHLWKAMVIPYCWSRERNYHLLFANLKLSLICKNLSPLNQSILCAKFGLTIGPVIQEKKMFNLFNVISLFSNYFLLEKDRALHLNKLESPLLKDTLCQVWLKLVLCFWRRRRKCEKFTISMTTNKFRSEKLTWAFSSQHRCAKKSFVGKKVRYILWYVWKKENPGNWT